MRMEAVSLTSGHFVILGVTLGVTNILFRWSFFILSLTLCSKVLRTAARRGASKAEGRRGGGT